MGRASPGSAAGDRNMGGTAQGTELVANHCLWGYSHMLGNIWSGFVGFLENVLLTFYSWTGNGGIAIILFTILARIISLPLTIKSIQSSRKMQELQPQVKEIQRKYGKDPQKLQVETAKLYREYKVTPVGGCLMQARIPIP